jgi:hypothetical protein
MAKYDPIVARPRGNSWRTSANTSDALRRHLYQEMLREELGRNPNFQPDEDEEGSIWLRPAAIVMLSILFFIAVFAGLMWRDGAFADIKWLPEVKAPTKGWMLGDKRKTDAAPNVSDAKPLESFIEPPGAVEPQESATADAAPSQ